MPPRNGKRRRRGHRNSSELIVNHLWQSSCFVLLAALLAFALRRHSPKVRYWVWLSASLKFLVPFALLVSVGNEVPRPTAHSVPATSPVFSTTLVQIAEPFSPNPSPSPVHNLTRWLPIAIVVVWALGVLTIGLGWNRDILERRRKGLPVTSEYFHAPSDEPLTFRFPAWVTCRIDGRAHRPIRSIPRSSHSIRHHR
jgi:beta-lactamase regulating signal transducer with metallopeptidase domain